MSTVTVPAAFVNLLREALEERLGSTARELGSGVHYRWGVRIDTKLLEPFDAYCALALRFGRQPSAAGRAGEGLEPTQVHASIDSVHIDALLTGLAAAHGFSGPLNESLCRELPPPRSRAEGYRILRTGE